MGQIDKSVVLASGLDSLYGGRWNELPRRVMMFYAHTTRELLKRLERQPVDTYRQFDRAKEPDCDKEGRPTLEYLGWMLRQIQGMPSADPKNAAKAGRWLGWVISALEHRRFASNVEMRSLVRMDAEAGFDLPHDDPEQSPEVTPKPIGLSFWLQSSVVTFLMVGLFAALAYALLATNPAARIDASVGIGLGMVAATLAMAASGLGVLRAPRDRMPRVTAFVALLASYWLAVDSGQALEFTTDAAGYAYYLVVPTWAAVSVGVGLNIWLRRDRSSAVA